MKNQVSKALQDTVAEHSHIDQVHFDADGNHYFQVHEFKKGVKKEDNGLYGRISKQNIIDKNARAVTIEHPIAKTKIVESVDREEILDAQPQSSLLININTLSAEEQAIIEKIRSKKGGKGKAVTNED